MPLGAYSVIGFCVVLLAKTVLSILNFLSVSTIKTGGNDGKLTKKLELNFFYAGFPACTTQFGVGMTKIWTMISL